MHALMMCLSLILLSLSLSDAKSGCISVEGSQENRNHTNESVTSNEHLLLDTRVLDYSTFVYAFS